MQEPQTPFVAIVDFEATCGDGIPGDGMEIIEFAVILAHTRTWEGLPDGEFTRFVRPVRTPILTRFCLELTTIPQQDVDWALGFQEVLEEFRMWLEARVPREAVTFCSWGDFDRRQLARQCAEIAAPVSFVGPHLNLRVLVARRLSLRRNEKQGLVAVAQRLGVPFQGSHHRGIDDCRNTLSILRAMPVSSKDI